MNVAQLRALLDGMNPDAEVCAWNWGQGWEYTVTEVRVTFDDDGPVRVVFA